MNDDRQRDDQGRFTQENNEGSRSKGGRSSGRGRNLSQEDRKRGGESSHGGGRDRGEE